MLNQPSHRFAEQWWYISGSSDIHLLDIGQQISYSSTVLNDFFASPRIQESVLNLTEEDFSDHCSNKDVTLLSRKSAWKL